MTTVEDDLPPKKLWQRKRFFKVAIPAAALILAALIGAWGALRGSGDASGQKSEQQVTGQQQMTATQQVFVESPPLPAAKDTGTGAEGVRQPSEDTNLPKTAGGSGRANDSGKPLKVGSARNSESSAAASGVITDIRDSTCSGSPVSHNQSGGNFALCIDNRDAPEASREKERD